MKVDLHIHTTYSDGAFSPQMIVDTALDCNLNVIALTDHDNILSYSIANDYALANDKKLEIIQGVEINTIYKDYEVHILGYFMDVNNSDFQSMLKFQQNARNYQAREMVALLHKKEGIRKTVSPHDACEVIYDAGGIPVFAHPIDVEISESLAKELMNYGLRGIEAYHRKHSPAVVEYYSSLAEKYGLIITGGSDFHAPSGNHGTIVMGKNFVPSWVYDELIKEKKRIEIS